MRLGAHDRAHERRPLAFCIREARRQNGLVLVVERLRSRLGAAETFELDGWRRPAGHPAGDVHEVLLARKRVGREPQRALDYTVGSDPEEQLPFPEADPVEVVGRILPVEEAAVSVVADQILVIHRLSSIPLRIVGVRQRVASSCHCGEHCQWT